MEKLTGISDGYPQNGDMAAGGEMRDGGIDVFNALAAEYAKARRQADQLTFDGSRKAEQGSAADQQRIYLRRREAALKKALDHLAAGKSAQEREAAGIDERTYPKQSCEIAASPKLPEPVVPGNLRRVVAEPRLETDTTGRKMRLGVVPALLFFAGTLTVATTTSLDLPILGWSANHARVTPRFHEGSETSKREQRMLDPELNTPVNLDGVAVLYPPFVTRLFRDFGKQPGNGRCKLPSTSELAEILKAGPQTNDRHDGVLFEIARGTLMETFKQKVRATHNLNPTDPTRALTHDFDRRSYFITRRDLEHFLSLEKPEVENETEKTRMLRAISAACRDTLPATGEPANYYAVSVDYDYQQSFAEAPFTLGFLPRTGISEAGTTADDRFPDRADRP